MDHRTTEAPEQRTVIEHAPLPWRLAGKGTIRAGKDFWVCSVNWHRREGNAALIVRAINNHDVLVKALEEIASLRGSSDETDMAREIARGALAALEGGK